MEKQKEKISKFSKVICVPISIAFFALMIIGAFQLLSWVVTTWNLPYIFKIGNIRVILPVILRDSFEVGKANLIIPEFLLGNIVAISQTVITIVILAFAKSFFKLLIDDGMPFRVEVVSALRKMAILLLVLGMISGIAGWVAAGIAYVLSLIFEYGCTLQNESDTTL